MQLLAIKTLAAGFTVSMAFAAHSAPQLPNADIQTAALYATPSIRQNQSSLDRWIEKLVSLESSGKEHLKIVDHNGYHSYGCLQFQKATFKGYGMRYDLIGPDDDLDAFIYDCGLQKAIAKRMIEDDYGNWQHWYTSVIVKKLGLPPKNNIGEIKLAEIKN